MAKDAKTKKKKSKYKAERCKIDDIYFDSYVEGDYYLMLKAWVETGVLVESFSLQPKYVLQDKFYHPQDGIVREIILKADFLVNFHNGAEAIVDIKGMATPEAKLKRKMFLNKYPEKNLQWISKSIKHGENGWIDYWDLEKIRRDNRKKKAKLKGK